MIHHRNIKSFELFLIFTTGTGSLTRYQKCPIVIEGKKKINGRAKEKNLIMEYRCGCNIRNEKSRLKSLLSIDVKLLQKM